MINQLSSNPKNIGEKLRAVIALADGSHALGYAYGSRQTAKGELVFNTSMTGYQEIISDPSYAGQIITFTYPHIGNVGVNQEDYESKPIRCAGIVIREPSPLPSNYRSEKALEDFLKEYDCPAISGVDTRMLTRKLRDGGCQNACIISFNPQDVSQEEAIAEAVNQAKKIAPIEDSNLAELASSTAKEEWTEKQVFGMPQTKKKVSQKQATIFVYDCGVKRNILRIFKDLGAKVEVIPYAMKSAEIIAAKPDAVVISNGPGDPMVCDKIIEDIKDFIAADIPLLGICLGLQLIGLAAGGKTIKLKFGHHGANHPVKRIKDGTVAITSQNHNFSIDEKSLPDDVEVTHISLFDNSVQGIRFKHKPVMAFQGHPEANPGPNDIIDIFTDFISLVHKEINKRD